MGNNSSPKLSLCGNMRTLTIRSAIVCLGLLFAFVGTALSDPSVSSVSGSVTHGESITISGTDFGTHADYGGSKDYLCALYDDWEDGNHTTSSGYWDSGNQSGVAVISSNGRTNSSYHARQARGSGQNGALGHSGDGTQETLYLAAWRYFDDFTTLTDTNCKSWRVYHEPGENTNWLLSISGATGWQSGNYQWNTECNGGGDRTGSFGADFNDNWAFYEILIDEANDSVKVWFNGDINSDESFSVWCSGVYAPDFIYFDAFSHESGTQYTYTDDAYISYTQARVMIGNQSTWTELRDGDGNESMELQIPTAWSTTSITVDVNQGAFADSSTNYVYVVKSDGTTNSSGYAVTFGQSGDGGAVSGSGQSGGTGISGGGLQ